MRKATLITGLDIGSSKVSAVAASIYQDGASSIMAQVTNQSGGISRGIIVDINAAIKSVSKALEKLREKTSARAGNIYVNISGTHVRGSKSKGMIPLSVRGREITRPDMDRCADVASTIHLPVDREIIHRITHNFSADDQPWIKNPMGLYAARLSCEVYVITADTNHIQNILKCVNSAGYDVKEMIYSGVADAAALLDNKEKEEGVLLLDIGASLTEVSLFSHGVMQETEVTPFGSNDMAGNFKDFGGFNELFSKIPSKGKAAVVTGGMAFTDGFIEFLEEKLSRPVRMGVVKDLKGELSPIEGVRFSTAIGLVKYAHTKHPKRTLVYKNMMERVSDKVIDIFNNYF